MASVMLAATIGVATAHHSLAMFDQTHPIELVGVVRQFSFMNPHTLIVLEVKEEEASPVIWRLEGNSANSLAWSGWLSTTLKPGDQLRLTVEPLRSGMFRGAWS